MGTTRFRSLVLSQGVPVLGALPIPLMTAANKDTVHVHFVDGTNGSNGNPGDSFDAAVKTIGQAHTNANAGDVIIVGDPNVDYAEVVTISKANISLIAYAALAGGRNRPAIVPASGIALTVTAAGFLAVGMRFKGVGGTNDGVKQQGDSFAYLDCDFESAGGDGLHLLPDNTDDAKTASEGRVVGGSVRDCGGDGIKVENPGVSGATGGLGPTGVQIIGVSFWGNSDRDIQDADATLSNDTTFYDSLIHDCNFLTRNKAVYITLTAGGNNRGVVSHSRFAKDSARLLNTEVVLPAGMVAYELYDATGLVDTSGF